jgi:hypothetical protein
VKMSSFSGQQLAQVDNPDPFAPPVWRSPIYHTPGWVITYQHEASGADQLITSALDAHIQAEHSGARGGDDDAASGLAAPG